MRCEYADTFHALKSGADALSNTKLTVVRNFTIDYYMKIAVANCVPRMQIDFRNFDNQGDMKAPINNDTFIVLYLPYLVGNMYYHSYSSTQEDTLSIMKSLAELIKERLLTLFRHIADNSIYFALFTFRHFNNSVYGHDIFDNLIEELNQWLIEYSRKCRNLTLINTYDILFRIGEANYYNTAEMYSIDAVLSRSAVNDIVFELLSRMQLRKIPVKCIVLDCDNVLWGGIIDETGTDGILIGPNGIGRIYLDFQRFLLRLKAEGYILCLCSKNDEKKVCEVFENNSSMLLRMSDIVSYRICFDNKSKGIKELSDELNMPVQEMVFIDDSPYEISEVSMALDIRTILLDNNNPHLHIRKMYDSGFFFKDVVTESDSQRTQVYRNNLMINKLGSSDDINRAIMTEVNASKAVQGDLMRVAELSYRTHQFNMSGIQYDETELKEIISGNNGDVYVFKVKDVYNDYGIIAAAVVKIKDDIFLIEGFYLSCRVIGRGFEHDFLEYILKNNTNSCKVVGVVISSELNKKFMNFYKEHNIETTISYKALQPVKNKKG